MGTIHDGIQSLYERLLRQQQQKVFDTLVKDWKYTGTMEELFAPKRFPALAIVVESDGSTYYFYNNGTVDGLFVIGFTKFEFKTEDNSVNVSYRELKTYLRIPNTN